MKLPISSQNESNEKGSGGSIQEPVSTIASCTMSMRQWWKGRQRLSANSFRYTFFKIFNFVICVCVSQKIIQTFICTASTASATQINPGLTDAPKRPRGVPLDVPLPGLPDQSFSSVEGVSYETKVSKLDNGFRVASQCRPGRYCTIGVAIKSGARFEKPFVRGVSHVAEKLGFLVNFEVHNVVVGISIL